MGYLDDIQRVSAIGLPWNKISGCDILVTGATGLIGSSLVEVLMAHRGRDFGVYVMGRNALRMQRLFERHIKSDGFHMLVGDVTEPLLSDHSFQYIIHAASGASPSAFSHNPVETMKANILGVTNLIEYGMRHNLHRFLYVSSGEIYGEGDGRCFTEDYSGYVDCTSPRSCYPSSKRAAETLCASYAAEYGVDVVIARPCHTFGPNFTENDNRVYAQFIRDILNNHDIVMKSTGEQYRSWCYVVDCVSGLLHILLKGKNGEAYNIADPDSSIRIGELAQMIASIGKKKVVFDIPTSDEKRGYNPVSQSVYCVDKLKQLGWGVYRDMYSNILSTIDYLRNGL